MFQSLKTVLFYCTAKWKAGHINTFSQNPCPPLPFCSPSQKQRKTTKHFSKPGGKVLTYCGFKSLLNHGAAAPSLTFLMNISLTSNSFARLAAGAVATCLTCMERGPISLCLKEAKEGLKICHGWGYGPVFPWTSSCLFPAVARYDTPHMRNVLCKPATSDGKLFCTPNYESTLLESCTIPHHPPWCGFSFSLQPDKKILFK